MYPPHRDFSENNIYLQWLHRRFAQPLRINRFLIKYLWGAMVVFVIFYDDHFFPGLEYILGIAGFMLTGVPIIFTLLYFLYYTPMAIHEDARSSTLDFIFASPVPTGEIVSNLRRFMAIQSIRICIPSFAWIVAMFLREWAQSGMPSWYWSDLTDWQNLGPIVFISITVISLWWMILEVGMVSAALPRYVTVTGMMFLLWIVPVLVLIFWGGYWVAYHHCRFWHGVILGGQEYGGHSHDWEWNSLPYWVMGYYSVLMTTAAFVPFLLTRKLMDLRRGGRW